MSGNRSAELRLLPPAKRRDARARRTRARLAASLRELMQRRTLSEISVQYVLDHAGVSRSAFYAHFNGKVDLLLTDLDEFLEAVATQLSRSRERSERVVVVAEFFAPVPRGFSLPGGRAAKNSATTTTLSDRSRERDSCVATASRNSSRSVSSRSTLPLKCA